MRIFWIILFVTTLGVYALAEAKSVGSIPTTYEECLERGGHAIDQGYKGSQCKWSVVGGENKEAFIKCLEAGGGEFIIEAGPPGSGFSGNNGCKLWFHKPLNITKEEYARQFLPDLKSQDATIRLKAVQQIVSVADGARAISSDVVKMLDDSRSEVRLGAVSVLIYLKEPSTASHLKLLLGDPDPGVRFESHKALALQKDKSIARSLSNYLYDPNPKIQSEAGKWFAVLISPPGSLENQSLWGRYPEKAKEWWEEHKSDPQFNSDQ